MLAIFCTNRTETSNVKAMANTPLIGIEQARATLPALVAAAHAGKASIITRHGKALAALVPISQVQVSRPRPGLLSLRGAGKGLWGPQVPRAIELLRAEWE